MNTVICKEQKTFNELVEQLPHFSSGYEDDSIKELKEKQSKLVRLNKLASKFLTASEPEPYPINGRPIANSDNFLKCSPSEAEGFLEAKQDIIDIEIERKDRAFTKKKRS